MSIIHILSFLFGIFLIYNGYNSLKKLDDNNIKWEKIKINSSSFNIELRDEFNKTSQLINKLSKFINILSKLSIVIGLAILVFTLITTLKINPNINLHFIGYLGIILISLFFLPFIVSLSLIILFSDGNGGATSLISECFDFYYKSNTQYDLLCNYFEYEYEKNISKTKGTIQNYDYNKKHNYELVVSRKQKHSDFFNYKETHRRFYILLSYYLGLLLFFLAFTFDNQFYQKVISFNLF